MGLHLLSPSWMTLLACWWSRVWCGACPWLVSVWVIMINWVPTLPLPHHTILSPPFLMNVTCTSSYRDDAIPVLQLNTKLTKPQPMQIFMVLMKLVRCLMLNCILTRQFTGHVIYYGHDNGSNFLYWCEGDSLLVCKSPSLVYVSTVPLRLAV